MTVGGSGGSGTGVKLRNITYKPHRAPTQFTLGNGLVETTTYNNRLQPCTITASTLLTLTFKYGATDSGNCDVTSNDNNGNILQQVISASGSPTFTQKYTYDAVNRIETVGENNDFWQRTYTYDAFGNRAATGSGITMGSPTPTAVTQFSAATNRITKLPTGADLDPDPNTSTDDPYDAAGNLVRHPIVGSMAYDAINKQRFYCAGHVTCTSGNAIAEYRYDGAGNRVEKLTSAETTTFVYDASGKLAAEYSTTAPTNSGLFFRTLDHLGSTRLVTDAIIGDVGDPDGDVVSRRDFLPFGEHIPADATFNRQALTGYNAGSAFTQQFTAKERDAESDLDYFLARYYSPKLGRFTSPDTPFADQFVGAPQSWNLYGYTTNSPLAHVDPDGRGKTKFVVSVVKKLQVGFRQITKRVDKPAKKIGKKEAQDRVRHGGSDVVAEGERGARKAAGKKPVRHNAHIRAGDDALPHQHPTNSAGKKQKGHAFVDKAKNVIPGATIGTTIFGDNLVGETVDFFNPISEAQDVFEVMDETVIPTIFQFADDFLINPPVLDPPRTDSDDQADNPGGKTSMCSASEECSDSQ